MKRLVTIGLMLVLSLGLVACSGKTAETGSTTEPEKESSTAARETISITHKLGTTEVPLDPQKVVVLDYGMLDTIDTLGATPELAIPQNDIPEYLKKYNATTLNIGGLKEHDMEAIHGFEPDLIILGARQESSYDEFAAIAPTIYMAGDNSRYLESSMENIEKMGKIFKKEDVVAENAHSLDEKIAKINEFVASNDAKTLILLTNEGTMSVYGEGSRFGGIIHDSCKFPVADENIEDSTHGQEVNYEYVSKMDPDFIFVIDRTAAIGGKVEAAETLSNDLIDRTKAAKNDNIVLLSPDVWYLSGGGLQSLTIMIDEILAAVA